MPRTDRYASAPFNPLSDHSGSCRLSLVDENEVFWLAIGGSTQTLFASRDLDVWTGQGSVAVSGSPVHIYRDTAGILWATYSDAGKVYVAMGFGQSPDEGFGAGVDILAGAISDDQSNPTWFINGPQLYLLFARNLGATTEIWSQVMINPLTVDADFPAAVIVSPTGGWDSGRLGHPSASMIDGSAYLFFTAGVGASMNIGVAVGWRSLVVQATPLFTTGGSSIGYPQHYRDINGEDWLLHQNAQGLSIDRLAIHSDSVAVQKVSVTPKEFTRIDGPTVLPQGATTGNLDGGAENFAAMKGINTRWEARGPIPLGFSNGRFSLQPNLGGLGLVDWYNLLVSTGANTATIGIDPADILWPNDPAKQATIYPYPYDIVAFPPGNMSGTGLTYTDVEFAAFRDIIYKPYSQRTAAENAALTIYSQEVYKFNYSEQQRVAHFVDFFSRLDAAANAGQIDRSKIRFLVHQRRYFEFGDRFGVNPPSGRAYRVAQWGVEFGHLINALKVVNLDYWLWGIRLGENGTERLNDYLGTTSPSNVVIALADAVNLNTSDWLKGKAFLANGGTFGADYTTKGMGVREYLLPAEFEAFLKQISTRTKHFALGYKWMSSSGGAASIQEEALAEGYDITIQGVTSSTGNTYDNTEGTGWLGFLGNFYGFGDTAGTIGTVYSGANLSDRYPNHAQIVWVGDSSDSIHLVMGSYVAPNWIEGGPWAPGANPSSVANSAVQTLFQTGRNTSIKKNFTGKILVRLINEVYDSPSADDGSNLFIANWPAGVGASPNPVTTKLWKRW